MEISYKLETKLPYDPLLGIYPETVIIEKDTYAHNVHFSTVTWLFPCNQDMEAT